ncbi:MAG: outer membrane beta-barrel protein [Acidobacteria bacterium]|nr:outer membrane beta-barrel protein [Acidobacteriota bacterium]
MTRVQRAATMGLLMGAVVVAMVAPAAAQAVHSVHIGAGLFAPRTLDARSSDDVLVENLNTLSFDIKDFRGATATGEWTVTFNERIEVGLSGGFYQRNVPSRYRDYININGAEIEQDLKLRVVPISGVVRFLPFGRAGTVQPYVGAGISALNWRYSETGEFVDFNNNFDVFRDRYVANGTTIGGVVLGGLRLPLGGDIYALNTEFRYQFGEGDLGSNGFLTEKIDLSGMNFTVGFQIRF